MQVNRDRSFQIPPSLHHKLLAFRRRVWCLKMLEAVAAALIGVLLGFLLIYGFDRIVDTPRWLRLVVFVAAVLSCCAVPLALERWVWRRRRIDQLANLLAQTHPNAGDQLLGVIHLSEDVSEQARSPELVAAAIRQVAANVESQDLSEAIPRQRHRQRGLVASLLAAAVVALLFITTSAATNAWARFLAPWSDVPRYTFAAIEPLPETMIVPHGESFDVAISLQDSSRWKPRTANVHVAGQTNQEASLIDGQYHFQLPGQIAPLRLGVKVGDYRGELEVEPKLRPELVSLRSAIQLPDYLGRAEGIERDIRGASTSAVRGSTVTLTARATRPLSEATVNGSAQVTQGERFSTGPIAIESSTRVELQWQDEFSLSGKEPLEITIDAVDDEPPSLICENLPRRKVLLDSEVLSFQVRAPRRLRCQASWDPMAEGRGRSTR